MDKKKAKKRIERLREVIRRHRYFYHVLDKQEISSEVLDSLKKELYDLEQEYPDLITPDSPTQRVAGEPLDRFEKVDHPFPMLSINDAFSREDLEGWKERNEKMLSEEEKNSTTYLCELKVDGVALELIYENGSLQTGATRGDGETGEDVTQNIKTIEAIPLRFRREALNKLKERYGKMPSRLVVRGEVLIGKKEFEKINERRGEEGKPSYANPRNLAAGSIRQLDPEVVARRNLDFYGYGVPTKMGQRTHKEEHEIMGVLGFKTSPEVCLCSDIESVLDFFAEAEEKRDDLDYEIDGIVVQINENRIFEKLGVAGKAPRGVLALKFPLKRATTRIKEIKVQVGRTGILTPVAVLEPVDVGGVTITRATLHNQEEIERLGVKTGDTVVVGRAGDVIPKVLKVLPEMRTGDEKDFKMPSQCPVCGHEVEKEEVLIRCVNLDCPARKRNIFYHFVSRGAFNIQGLGPKIVDRLLEEKLIQTPADLFDLKQEDLVSLEGFGEKLSQNLIESIQKSKELTLPRFLYSLGIPQIGEETAYLLARRFRTLENIVEADREELEQVPDIGPKVADSVYKWFRRERNKRYLDDLDKAGVEIRPFIPSQSGSLEGKTIVFTGSLSSMTRKEANRKVRSLGGDPSASVSSNTDYLVAGESPGMKLNKARELKIKVLSEKEFLKLIHG